MYKMRNLYSVSTCQVIIECIYLQTIMHLQNYVLIFAHNVKLGKIAETTRPRYDSSLISDRQYRRYKGPIKETLIRTCRFKIRFAT
jgi:hypothetical protein